MKIPKNPLKKLANFNFDLRRQNLNRGAPLFLRSLVWSFRDRNLVSNVRTYCMFIGYPRSGHTLVAALLDAHPDMVVCTGGRALGLLRRASWRRAALATQTPPVPF